MDEPLHISFQCLLVSFLWFSVNVEKRERYLNQTVSAIPPARSLLLFLCSSKAVVSGSRHLLISIYLHPHPTVILSHHRCWFTSPNLSWHTWRTFHLSHYFLGFTFRASFCLPFLLLVIRHVHLCFVYMLFLLYANKLRPNSAIC